MAQPYRTGKDRTFWKMNYYASIIGLHEDTIRGISRNRRKAGRLAEPLCPLREKEVIGWPNHRGFGRKQAF